MRRYKFILGLLVLLPGVLTADSYDGLSNDEIRDAAATEIRDRAASLAGPHDRTGTLDAVLELLKTRAEIFEELQRVRDMHEMDNIRMADAIDDSLVHGLGEILIPYVETHTDPILNPGTEKFRDALQSVGFVGNFATGLLVHLELQQTLFLLADFRDTRSDAEVEAAEDAFLRHFALLAQLHRAQHQELEDLHQCNMANLDWTVGRLESENGTHDFVIANRFFAAREDGFAYLLKLSSPSTGETMDAYYPLPYLTRMDAGWERMQQEKAEADGSK